MRKTNRTLATILASLMLLQTAVVVGADEGDVDVPATVTVEETGGGGD